MCNIRFTMVAILLLFVISGVFGGEISGCDPKKACKKDFKLDILLMYDQSGSMQGTNYEKFREASLEWVQAFFDIEGFNDTQFAVMGCEKQEIFHSFKDGNFKVEIPNAISKIKHDGKDDNLDKCSEKAVTGVFTPQAGDREDATNVVLWISDCDFFEIDWIESHQRHINAAKTLQVDKKADFYFVCCNSSRGHRLDTYYKNLMLWLEIGNKTNKSIIRYDYDNANLGKEAMDKVIAIKEVDIVDCLFTERIQNCTFDRNVSKCIEEAIYLVERQPYPRKGMGFDKNGVDCPTNITKQVCSGCTFPEDFIPATEESVAVAGSDATRKAWVVWVIIGVVGGLLLLLILLLVVAFLVVRRRRKQKMMKQEALGSTKQEKGKGIQADLTVMGGESKMQKTSKKQMSVQPKKTTAQPQKSPVKPKKTAAQPNKAGPKKVGKVSKN